ncbi:DUF2680 domain-containing protein [Desulfosporosinus fructosivorans]
MLLIVDIGNARSLLNIFHFILNVTVLTQLWVKIILYRSENSIIEVNLQRRYYRMKKKLAAGVLSIVLLVGGATAAIAATDSSKLDEIKSLTQQMLGINKQIVDKEVGAGLITQQQADAMKSSIDLRQNTVNKL